MTTTEEKVSSIDGQMVIIPRLAEWDRIITDGHYLGVPVSIGGSTSVTRDLVDFVTEHQNEFSLGIVRPGFLDSWLALPLMKIGNGWQRVHIEYPTCEYCGWRGAIANPTEPSIYFLAPNERDALERAWLLARVPCPSCGSSLPRVAIWAESVH